MPKDLKDQWEMIDQDEVERTLHNKQMNKTFSTRDEPRLRKTDKKRKRFERDENNITDWRNRHIRDKIEEAMKVVNKKAADKKGPIRKTANPKPSSNLNKTS